MKQDLQIAARAVERAETRYREALEQRDAIIREARAGGMRLSAIAELTGLARQRVAQICGPDA